MNRRRSLRVRLTATYAVAFAIGGALLLGAAYVIVVHTLPKPLALRDLSMPGVAALPSVSAPAQTVEPGQAAALVPAAAVPTVQAAQARQRSASLRDVLWWFLAALAVVTAASVAAGWHVAGRALAPIRRITATARDVSADRLGARIALSGPQDELRELADTFDGMLERLERAFAAQGRFVASASHELRTPLTLVRAEADVVLADPDATPAELREALGEVRTTAERGGDVVSALLQLARSEHPLAAATSVDVAAVLAAALAEAGRAATAAGVSIVGAEPAPAAANAIVAGDAALLRSLVDNLLANAVAYNHRGGRVDVDVRVDDGSVLVEVTNTGAPVGPEDVAGLFAPFARGEPSRSRDTGGAGLGLAIAWAVAEAHDGAIAAEPGPDGGLRVTVRLPVAGPS